MRNHFSALTISFFCVGWALVVCGCKPRVDPSVATRLAAPSTTDIPLRIVILAPLADPDSVQRQWRSGSEQPIAIQTQSVEEFLSQEKCQADVVLFPGYLLGELVAKDWVVKLPNALGQTNSNPSNGSQSDANALDAETRPVMPRAWQAAATYDGVSYAIPLGCSLPVIVGSNALAERVGNQPTTWDALLAAMESESQEQVVVPESNIDRGAIVDRFLALIASASEKNKKYGLLFDLKTMKPRLDEVEFLWAAAALAEMAKQPGGRAAVLGSHEQAWIWAASHDRAVTSIATTTLLGPTASGIESGAIFEIDGFSFVNTGGGLLAALASSCQQTQQSTEFLRWLEGSPTRAFLAPMINGIDVPLQGGVESLAHRSRRSLTAASSSDQLFQEPRLPDAHRFRIALGIQLADFLQSKQDAAEALRKANESWIAIQSANGSRDFEALKSEYQQSLGLTQ